MTRALWGGSRSRWNITAWEVTYTYGVVLQGMTKMLPKQLFVIFVTEYQLHALRHVQERMLISSALKVRQVPRHIIDQTSYVPFQLFLCVLSAGKMNRGLSVLDSLKHLLGDREPTVDEISEANILGWCIEWLQAFFLVSDDIMDGTSWQ